MEFRIQYMRLVCTHYFPVPVIEQSLRCVHVCFLGFVCVSSLHSSCSDITKIWIASIQCGCLPQHIQTLTPTPGIHFINITPHILLGLWYSLMGYPHTPPVTLSLYLPTLGCPVPSMHALPPFIWLWPSTQICLLQGYLCFSGLGHLVCMPGQTPI